MYRQFSKQNLRSKEVHLQGVLWETTDFICESKDCGRVTNGYGNYVSKLKERVDELEAQLAALAAYATAANPMTEEGDRVANGRSRLREAYCKQQPLPVPDQMALVFRADLMRVENQNMQYATHRRFLMEREDAIKHAIGDYYMALDLRAHGSVAAGDALAKIQNVLGMRWKQNEELTRRLGEAAQTAAVPPMLEGTWLITQGNGRQYTVHSSAKANIARDCGYTVEEIRRDAESAPGQSNQCITTGNQA
jgi:hypothetical protein